MPRCRALALPRRSLTPPHCHLTSPCLPLLLLDHPLMPLWCPLTLSRCSIMPSRCLLPHPVTLERILLSLWCLPIAFNSSSAPLNAFSPSLNAYPSHFNASPLLFNAFPLPFTAFSSPCTAFHTTFYHTQTHLNASLLSFNALTLPFNASSSPFSTSLLPAAPLLVMPCNSLFKIPVSQCKVYIFTLSMLNHLKPRRITLCSQNHTYTSYYVSDLLHICFSPFPEIGLGGTPGA